MKNQSIFSKSSYPSLCEDEAFGKIKASLRSRATCLNGSMEEQFISLFHLCLGHFRILESEIKEILDLFPHHIPPYTENETKAGERSRN